MSNARVSIAREYPWTPCASFVEDCVAPVYPDQIEIADRYAFAGLVEYLSPANRQPDGTYRALARVGNALAVVEVTPRHPRAGRCKPVPVPDLP